ncbi:MAG: hypothetical protein AAGF12_39870 [Myxococcota bacterium]
MTVASGARATFARSAEAGFTASELMSRSLTNSGGITLRGVGTAIDTVNYGAIGFPGGRDGALSSGR